MFPSPFPQSWAVLATAPQPRPGEHRAGYRQACRRRWAGALTSLPWAKIAVHRHGPAPLAGYFQTPPPFARGGFEADPRADHHARVHCDCWRLIDGIEEVWGGLA